MSDASTASTSPAAPASLRASSLMRRAVFGLLAVLLGSIGAAWLMHASTTPPSAATTASEPAIHAERPATRPAQR